MKHIFPHFSLFRSYVIVSLSSTFYLSPPSFLAYPLLSLSPSVSFFICLLLSFLLLSIFLPWVFLCLSSNFAFYFYLFLCLLRSFLALFHFHSLPVFCCLPLLLLFIFLRICLLLLSLLLLAFLSSCSSFLYFLPFNFLSAFSAYFSSFFFLFYLFILFFFPLSFIILC